MLQEVARSAKKAVIRRPRDAALSTEDLLTVEMGFDRGELLGGVNAFLFVEGRADQAVLDGLYGTRVRELGVRVLPVHGQRKQAGVLDMELLLSYLSTPIAVLFDSVTDDDVRHLRASRKARLGALSDARRDERHTVATILEAATRAERAIEILALGMPDIFFTIDESAVKASHPGYPGHESAEAEFARASPTPGTQPRANASARKDFYSRAYGIGWSAEQLGAYAATMRALGLDSPALASVMDTVERLTLA